MYKLTPNTVVDLAAERAAVVRHLAQTWESIINLPELVASVQRSAFVAARAWFDPYPVGQRLREARTQREAALQAVLLTPEARQLGPWHDSLHSLLFYLDMRLQELRDAAIVLDGRWDFEHRANRLHDELVADFPDLPRARPLGWPAKGSSAPAVDLAGAEAAFDGADTAGAGAFNFVVRTSLHHVLYDETEQGRKASRVLVGSLFGHFLKLAEHCNTCELLTAIDALPLAAAPAEVLFDAPALATGNPLLQALMRVAEPTLSSAENYADSLAQARAFAALPTAEQEAVAQRNEALLLASIRDQKDREQARKEEEARASKLREALMTVLPA